jgi:hypothetical protein
MTLEQPDRLDLLKAKNILGRLIRLFDPTSAENRPYAIGSNRETIVLVVHVPVKVVQLIHAYVEIVGKSRDEVCAELLTQGLMMYLKAKQALLKTQLEMERQRRRIEVTTKRKAKPSPIARNQQLPKRMEDRINR